MSKYNLGWDDGYNGVDPVHEDDVEYMNGYYEGENAALEDETDDEEYSDYYEDEDDDYDEEHGFYDDDEDYDEDLEDVY